jgi:alkylation response protein AidB-like acyl-CoA dehydrogenase
MELDEFRSSLDTWLDRHDETLRATHGAGATLDDQMAHLSLVKRLTYEAGWMRFGWPERVGGLGGSPLLRAYLGEALTSRDLVEPGIYSMTEVLAPTMIDFARPELAAVMVPRLLSGAETWCQGFSEPGTGSNLAALTCRATRDGDAWHVTGQKVWTSLAQYADRCVLLTRTGSVDSAHRGITALFVDMDSPGIVVRPIETMHGAPEFSEVFFDDVVVRVDRTLGHEGQGWAVAMDLLPYERSTALWHRAAYLYARLQSLLHAAPPDSLDPVAVGEVAQLVFALRARSRATQHRVAAGEHLGPETSIDKVLVATAEQAVFDLVADGLGPDVAMGDDPTSARWRRELLYSRAATIYGGTAEIQRNIIARRLLDLGADR